MLRSTKLFQNVATKASGAASMMARRSFVASAVNNGGHGHAHADVPRGPYDAPHHHHQTEEAWLFGINPNEEYKWEGWEDITFFTYAAAFAMLFFGSYAKDGNSFKNWAKAEALARREVRENGEEIEFGKWYSQVEEEHDFASYHNDGLDDIVEKSEA